MEFGPHQNSWNKLLIYNEITFLQNLFMMYIVGALSRLILKFSDSQCFAVIYLVKPMDKHFRI